MANKNTATTRDKGRNKKIRSTITWNAELGEWLVKQTGNRRAIGGYVRSIMSMIMNGTLIMSTGNQVVGIKKELSAAEIKLRSGKKKKIKGAVKIHTGSAVLFAELNKELKAVLSNRKIDKGSCELRDEMLRSGNSIRDEMLKAIKDNPPPDPPRTVNE